MSINRINSHSIANIYNVNSSKSLNNNEKINQIQRRDRIEISSLGKSIKDYSLDISIDNSKRIEEIKEKIENGTYSVDANLTARSILNSIKESK
ncbi:flagellar biosynthesis anti-sigma factor FlgM [Clostridium weizhouense]|uniref:Negative regulator of flagellin synthesis n=1 Tax=Clostridium weizhouense TaxID=2859781 RepID=A0ABS7AIX9_9CLOT|nr:flagellar biosynthesis anti-sigma factor FlgM [Clostridium weizhouense]MBW6408592.1 flagellar biosynthesis anti-sigma factor FlgM [Clostridium weizhouense]